MGSGLSNVEGCLSPTGGMIGGDMMPMINMLGSPRSMTLVSGEADYFSEHYADPGGVEENILSSFWGTGDNPTPTFALRPMSARGGGGASGKALSSFSSSSSSSSSSSTGVLPEGWGPSSLIEDDSSIDAAVGVVLQVCSSLTSPEQLLSMLELQTHPMSTTHAQMQTNAPLVGSLLPMAPPMFPPTSSTAQSSSNPI